MKTGITVYCAVCHRPKAPRGRSVADAIWNSMCTAESNCVGYYQPPLPGDLWLGETEEDFGYPVSPHATEDR